MTYKDYRRYGHGVMIAGILSLPPWAFYGPVVTIGFILAMFT